MMSRRRIAAIVALWWALMAAAPFSVWGQIRIVAPEALQEAAHPTLAEGATMTFAEGSTISFGTITEESSAWSTTLHWSNGDGGKTTITRITTSCSCITAKWDRRRSTESSSGTIEVVFTPKGHIGTVGYKLFVYTSLSESRPTAVVEIKGRVEPATDGGSLYPYLCGALALRQQSVKLPAGGGKVRVAVKNVGSEPLTVTHDKELTTSGIVAYTEPRVLTKGEEGFLWVEYEKGKRSVQQAPPMLYLDGVNTPPRKRKIELIITD